MTKLHQRALATVPLTKDTVSSFYDGTRSGTAEQCLKALCESHERLRMELQGAEILLNELPRWQIETPPMGVWAYSETNGLFRIRGKTDTNYLVITKLCRFDRKIEIGTTYTVFVDGPFLYPLPNPFSWEMPQELKNEIAVKVKDERTPD